MEVLCLKQEDDAEKGPQAATMRKIYRLSSSLVARLEGSDLKFITKI